MLKISVWAWSHSSHINISSELFGWNAKCSIRNETKSIFVWKLLCSYLTNLRTLYRSVLLVICQVEIKSIKHFNLSRSRATLWFLCPAVSNYFHVSVDFPGGDDIQIFPDRGGTTIPDLTGDKLRPELSFSLNEVFNNRNINGVTSMTRGRNCWSSYVPLSILNSFFI